MLPVTIVALFAITTADAPPTDAPKIAVLDLKAAVDTADLALGLTDALSAAIADTGLFQVIAKSEIDSMLAMEQLKDAVGCDDVSCLAEIGGALGVDRIVSGRLARAGDGFLVTLQLINIRYATAENRISRTWKGDAADLPQVVAAAADALVIPANKRKPTALVLTGLPDESEVFVDGEAKPLPTGGRITGLDVGPHELRVAAEDHAPLNTHFVLRDGQELV